jgi:YHS domain-containing protein
MAIDPVCKMQVNEAKPAATSDYHGKTYYFCAVSCKRKFDENPEKYLKAGETA